MNKKSFLRGFGTGVLFTAIILGISFLVRMSDAQIISRAKKLGMSFESSGQKTAIATPEAPQVSANPLEEPKTDNENTTPPEISKKPEGSKVPAASKEPKSTKKPKATKSPSEEFDDAKKDANKKANDAKKKLTINDGDWAGKVSQELEKMGIIDSSADFDKYLVDNGYSDIIRSGTYDVSPDDSFHDIAEKITAGF